MMLANGVHLAVPARSARREPRPGRPLAGQARSFLAGTGGHLGERLGRRAPRGAQAARRAGDRRQMSCSALFNLLDKGPRAEVPDVPPEGKAWEYKYLYDGACSVCRGLVRLVARTKVQR